LAARSPEATSSILGAGASVNDLSPDDSSRIEAATTASMNTAAILPTRLDIVALQRVAGQA
jgi:hypothetical protein